MGICEVPQNLKKLVETLLGISHIPCYKQLKNGNINNRIRSSYFSWNSFNCNWYICDK